MWARGWIAMGVAALLAPTSWAGGGTEIAGMKVEPGKWEFKTYSNLPMGDPRIHVTTQCLREGSIKPEVFTKDAVGCSISDTKTSETAMSWKMSCSQAGRQLVADAKFTSAGDSVEGVLAMALLFDDQRMEFEQTWLGSRVGACD